MQFQSAKFIPPELLSNTSLDLALDPEIGCINLPLVYGTKGEIHKSIVVTGDWGPNRSSFNIDNGNKDLLYGDMLPILRSADLSITNLESVFLRRTSAPISKDGPNHKLDPEEVATLTCVPIHMACLANNHIYDYGRIGHEDTLDVLLENEVLTLGASFNSSENNDYLRYMIEDVCIAFLNFAEGEEALSQQTDLRLDKLSSFKVLKTISQAKHECDIVIVIVHAGCEFLPVPAPYIREIYRSFIKSGADLVVAHHPHVPQGIEIYKSKPIVYSLGNFLFGRNHDSIYQTTGFVLKVNIHDRQIDSLQLYPYRISRAGLKRIEGRDLEDFLSEMRALSTLIEDDTSFVSIWHAYTDHWFFQGYMGDLSVSLASIVSERRMIRSVLIALAQKMERGLFFRRIARSLLWRIIHFLEDRDANAGTGNHEPFTYLEKRHAAILRNRLDTLAHRELYLNALDRIASGKMGDTPIWTSKLVQMWKN